MQRETKRTFGAFVIQMPISIHSLYAEGDNVLGCVVSSTIIFQSTPSMQRETSAADRTISRGQFQSTPSMQRETSGVILREGADIEISIHSLYAEGDRVISKYKRKGYISIHSLYAEGDLCKRPSTV